MSERRPAVMYSIAAVSFLIAGAVGLVGDSDTSVASWAFIGLCAVFAVLAVNAWRSARSSSDT